MINENLLLTPSQKIEEWQSITEKKIFDGFDIVLIGDTETTGGVRKGMNRPSVKEKDDKEFLGFRHRVVEVAFFVCYLDKKTNQFINLKDSEGHEIYFHEYINFFKEDESFKMRTHTINDMPFGAFNVHAISPNFLAGETNLGYDLAITKSKKYNIPMNKDFSSELKLPRSAPTFMEIIDPLMAVCGLKYKYGQKEKEGRIHAMFNNTGFDLIFMDSEFQILGYPPFQSFVLPMDTIILSKSLFSKKDIEFTRKEKENRLRNELSLSKMSASEIDKKIKEQVVGGIYSLDAMVQFLTERKLIDVSHINRNLHGALKDSEILKHVANAIFKSTEYRNCNNLKNHEIIQESYISNMLKHIGEQKNQKPIAPIVIDEKPNIVLKKPTMK